MKAFMDKDFLLETPTAQHLYHDYSAKLPIVDMPSVSVGSTINASCTINGKYIVGG